MAQRAALVAGVPAQVLTALLPRDEGRTTRRGYRGMRRLPPLPSKTSLLSFRTCLQNATYDPEACPAWDVGIKQGLGPP